MEPPSPIFVLKKVGESITDLQFWDDFTPNQENAEERSAGYLLSGYSNDGGIDIWNLQTRRAIAHHSSSSGVVSVHGNSLGEIVMVNKDGELRCLDCEDGRIATKSLLNLSNIGFCKASCLVFGKETLAAVPGEETSSICVWNITLQELLWRLVPGENHKLGMAMCIKLIGDEKSALKALGGYEDGSVILWDVASQTQLCKLRIFDYEPVMCIDYDTTTKKGIVGSPSEILVKFSLCGGGALQAELSKERKISNPGVADLKIRPDFKIVAAGGWDGNVRIFSWRTLKPLAILAYHGSTVQSLAFRNSPESEQQILASGSADHKIAVWRIYN